MTKRATTRSDRRGGLFGSDEKYKDRVNFVVVDLDVRSSPAQQELVKKYYTGTIPHVTVLDRNGKAVYDDARS